MKKVILGVAISTLALVAFANTSTPYAGQESRTIKALSEKTIKGYEEGKGLAYAKAAELNHFPGPRHVLDLAEALDLSDQQILKAEALFINMKRNASALGKQFVKKEQELDSAFSRGNITEDTLKVLLTDISALQADIRYVHLHAHLLQRALLTTHQIHLYDQLRGYSVPSGGKHHRLH